LGGAGGAAGGAGGLEGGAGGAGGLEGGTGGSSGSGGLTGGTGGASGGSGGAGGEGGAGCPPVASCNWCGGDELHDANGCITGFICENGADPCAVSECPSAHDCAEDETCMRDSLCWPAVADSIPSTLHFAANPCTTDPCLPGTVAVVTSTMDPSVEYVLVVDGGWIQEGYDWETEWGYAFGEGSMVMAFGRVLYHTDIDGQLYLELELHDLTPRVL